MTEHFIEQCKALANTLGLSFALRKRALKLEEVFSEYGMLPGLVERANQRCVLCFGYGLGVEVVDEDRSMLGKRLVLNERAPVLLVLYFLADILVELAAKSSVGGVVELEELLIGLV